MQRRAALLFVLCSICVVAVARAQDMDAILKRGDSKVFNVGVSLTSTNVNASATFNLTANQFVLTGLGSAIFGANRATLGELHNVTVEFEVIGGTGKVLPFVSSVDNGSSDSTFRTE